MKIYLIRHGETDWNRQMRFQGRENVPLNDAGITQAKACGKALAGRGITVVYTSPLQRAVDTGMEIAMRTGLTPADVHVMPELIERDLGEFSGKCVSDRSSYFSLSASEDTGGMEPFSEVLVRMKQAISKIAAKGDAAAAVVSHGAAINVLLAGLSDFAVGTGKTKLYNGGVSILEGNGEDGFCIRVCNQKPEELEKFV